MTTGINSQQDLHAQIRASWDVDAASYDLHPGHGKLSNGEYWAWRRVLGDALDPLARQGPLQVLDVGTGTAPMALLLANMGHQVVGADISAAMLAVAQQKAETQGLPVRFIEATAEALPLPDASMDVVFSRHLFWTLPDPHGALREWVRVVKPGGIVAIADGWWREPGRWMEGRRTASKLLGHLFTRETHQHPGYAAIMPQLPLAGGISPYSIRYYLDNAGLERIRVRDLAMIRAAEHATRPVWQRIGQARFTWLATGFRP